MTFFDTADVYGDGRSEQMSAASSPPTRTPGSSSPPRWAGGSSRCRRTTSSTTSGRGPTAPAATSASTAWTWCSCTARRRAVIDDDATYDALDTLVEDGAIAAYGVSVETVDQALAAIARPHVASVQIILNAFRLKPLDAGAARRGRGRRRHHRPGAAGLGPAVRASTTASTTFAEDDHRSYNRDGSAFDVGETFSGVDYETGVAAAGEFTALVAASAPD